jgi:hypothetical protein
LFFFIPVVPVVVFLVLFIRVRILIFLVFEVVIVVEAWGRAGPGGDAEVGLLGNHRAS